MKDIQLLKFTKYPVKGKKYSVQLLIDGKRKTINFGATGYSDFTKHKDNDRKKNYLARHKPGQNWTRTGVNTAGFWSRWISWNKPTIESSLNDTLKRFRIKDSRK